MARINRAFDEVFGSCSGCRSKAPSSWCTETEKAVADVITTSEFGKRKLKKKKKDGRKSQLYICFKNPQLTLFIACHRELFLHSTFNHS